MASVATIAIANADGSDYVVINQSDYLPDVHIPWQEQPTQPTLELGREHWITQRAAELADSKTVTELKAMAKDLGISGYSKMNQADLSVAIAESEAGATAGATDDN
ncbi:Rho termination factor N-terminal domain-containing protein [Leptothoe sp. PORK10 BA2]|uniref:Rho termination factor N-terminal domain-containing protein n=1 Tax=Leptothoe sp. PORK10 BA2 TaxID=3110254 RepID=UPI002B217ECC|nr:Rho termination factor N-terminal domain-containing protein [Leptothoe sp. PORK10 BA2]MEA5465267.1 Rho termination factor N-terminal domain-containing protein [Leptothoe sp. PORK10 BA2]